MKIIQAEGTHFQIGKTIGRATKKIVAQLYRELKFSSEILAKTEELEKILSNETPEFLEIIRGISQSTEIKFIKMLAYIAFQSEITALSERCTTILAQGQNGPIIAHSEDDYFINHDKFTLTKIKFPNGVQLLSGIYASILPGDNVGINNYGLAVSMNALNAKNSAKKLYLGLPISFVGLRLLSCKSLIEAEKFLSNTTINQSSHFLITHESGRALSAEILPTGERKLRFIKQIAHANHPLDLKLQNLCKATTSSLHRQKIASQSAKKFAHNFLTLENAQNFLKIQKAHNQGICKTGKNPYRDVSTIASIIAQPKNKTLTVNSGPPCIEENWQTFSL